MKNFSLKILSLNLWNTNHPVEKRMEKLIKFLRIEKPDIVALQEVSPWKGKIQSEILSEEAGYEYVHYCKSGYWKGREEGNAIMSLLNSREIFRVSLPFNEKLDLPRTFHAVSISFSGQKIIFANTHLSYHQKDSDFRCKQMELILKELQILALSESPNIIFCGDWNDVPDSGPVQKVFGGDFLSFQDTWHSRNNRSVDHTFSKNNPYALPELIPGRRIDYIAFSSLFNSTNCSIVFTEKDEWGLVSDHYGLLANLELKIN